MNKTPIKNFAICAREQLIKAVRQRAYEYGITENGENRADVDTIGDRLLTADEKKLRQQLIAEIKSKGYTQVMEEAAYTWFKRFIALRFMEVNGLLPSKVRVFTDENGAFKPEILKEAMTVEIDGLDRSIVLELLEKQNNEELYKYLLITQCNALNQDLPYMFEKISNWTELLFPANLLRPDSVIGKMIAEIPEEDFRDEVEIIGWLYQFYISEKHEAVVDPLHGKEIKKEDIPAATQLFTTDWVVRYILDNSLGRYWIERHPESKLAEKLIYLATPKDGTLAPVNEHIAPEELKVLDPCVGSGHFLSYAFDILLEIYRECGWSDRDAAKSIVENNLYGLDIDDRATQLACFAVAMKARKYNHRILNGETVLNIVAMQDSDFITDDFIHDFSNENDSLRKEIRELRAVFNNAKEYGSTIYVPKLDYTALYARIDSICRSLADGIFQKNAAKLRILVKQAEILSGKYDIVATNPPYMNKYSPRLKAYIQQNFADYKGDLFSVFMFRNFAFCKENGYSGFMTPNVWMFIKSYEELRRYIIDNKSIASLIQMAKGAFFKEATVDICAFVLTNQRSNNNGLYIRLEDFRGDMDVQKQKVLEALANKDCGYFYEANQSNFSKIPGTPIAYWLSDKIVATFQYETIGDIAKPRQGLATGCNDLFIRLWYEVSSDNVCYDARSIFDAKQAGVKWFPYNKGGEFRKWYGNNDYLVNWENNGQLIRNFKNAEGKLRSRPQNTQFYFKESISWSLISSGTIAFRYKPYGHIFDIAGMSCFAERNLMYLLGLCNSPIALEALAVLAPTINFQAGDIANIPVVVDESQVAAVENLVENNVDIAKQDWDAFEISWDFKKHPLV